MYLVYGLRIFGRTLTY